MCVHKYKYEYKLQIHTAYIYIYIMYSTYQTRSICTIVFVVVKQTDGGVVGGVGYGRRTMTGVMLADTAICLYMYVCKVDVQAEPFISCCFAGLHTYKNTYAHVSRLA